MERRDAVMCAWPHGGPRDASALAAAILDECRDIADRRAFPEYAELSAPIAAVAPGGACRLDLDADCLLAALEHTGYATAVVYVTANGHSLSPDGTSIAAARWDVPELEAGRTYRLLVTWAPFGVTVESTGSWPTEGA